MKNTKRGVQPQRRGAGRKYPKNKKQSRRRAQYEALEKRPRGKTQQPAALNRVP